MEAGEVVSTEHEIALLRKRVQVLEETLEPFARCASKIPSFVEDHVSLTSQVKYGLNGTPVASGLSVRHVRSAAIALLDMKPRIV